VNRSPPRYDGRVSAPAIPPRLEVPLQPDELYQLLGAIRRQYRLSWHGIHGVGHWARVLDTGLRLASLTGADPEVVSCFALFHDACRANDGYDPRHGARGAELAATLAGTRFEGRPELLRTLVRACTLHTDGRLDEDATVGTCWDADRLDLLRVGIEPSPRKLCTAAARDSGVLAWANDRACRNYVPSFARGGWLRPDTGRGRPLR
jgi:uncharacterized protein